MDQLIDRRPTHLSQLRGQALAAAADPRRRTLHALRLSIKSLRYQEECGFGHHGAQPSLVQSLKEAQNILGAYEDRAQFRKLARHLDLKATQLIERDLHRARKRARALPRTLLLDLQLFLPSQEALVEGVRSHKAR
jgi:CHAD domain-containing protein